MKKCYRRQILVLLSIIITLQYVSSDSCSSYGTLSIMPRQRLSGNGTMLFDLKNQYKRLQCEGDRSKLTLYTWFKFKDLKPTQKPKDLSIKFVSLSSEEHNLSLSYVLNKKSINHTQEKNTQWDSSELIAYNINKEDNPIELSKWYFLVWGLSFQQKISRAMYFDLDLVYSYDSSYDPLKLGPNVIVRNQSRDSLWKYYVRSFPSTEKIQQKNFFSFEEDQSRLRFGCQENFQCDFSLTKIKFAVDNDIAYKDFTIFTRKDIVPIFKFYVHRVRKQLEPDLKIYPEDTNIKFTASHVILNNATLDLEFKEQGLQVLKQQYIEIQNVKPDDEFIFTAWIKIGSNLNRQGKYSLFYFGDKDSESTSEECSKRQNTLHLSFYRDATTTNLVYQFQAKNLITLSPQDDKKLCITNWCHLMLLFQKFPDQEDQQNPKAMVQIIISTNKAYFYTKKHIVNLCSDSVTYPLETQTIRIGSSARIVDDVRFPQQNFVGQIRYASLFNGSFIQYNMQEYAQASQSCKIYLGGYDLSLPKKVYSAHSYISEQPIDCFICQPIAFYYIYTGRCVQQTECQRAGYYPGDPLNFCTNFLEDDCQRLVVKKIPEFTPELFKKTQRLDLTMNMETKKRENTVIQLLFSRIMDIDYDDSMNIKYKIPFYPRSKKNYRNISTNLSHLISKGEARTQITFNFSFPQDIRHKELVIDVKTMNFYDICGNFLDTNKINTSIEFYPVITFTKLTEFVIDFIKIYCYIIMGGAILCFILLLFGGSTSKFWIFIEYSQLLYCFVYVNTDHPLPEEKIIKTFPRIFSFKDYYPNILNKTLTKYTLYSFNDQKIQDGSGIQNNFEQFNYHKFNYSLLLNIDRLLLIYVVVLIIYILIRYLNFRKSAGQLISKLKALTNWSLIIRICILTYLELMLCVNIQIIYNQIPAEQPRKIEYINKYLSWVFAAISFMIPIIFAIFIFRNKDKLDDDDIKENIGSLYENFDRNSRFTLNFYSYILGLRFVFSVIFIFGSYTFSEPLRLIGALIIISVVDFCVIFVQRPYSNPRDNQLCLISNVCFVGVYLTLSVIAGIELIRALVSEQFRMLLGWIMVGFIIIWATICLIFLVLDVKDNWHSMLLSIKEVRKLLLSGEYSDEAEIILKLKMKKKYKRRQAIKDKIS